MINQPTTFQLFKGNLRPILYRNSVTFTNIIFLVVSILLLVFKEFQDTLFLISVVLINILIGTIQDLRAKIALEKLQILMIPKVVVIQDQQEKIIAPQEIVQGEQIKIALGEQIPADGIVLESRGLEINEGLLTGETINIPKKPGETVLAGSFVVAGTGIFQAKVTLAESYVSKMTQTIKLDKINLSPIQRNLGNIVKYSSYLLVFVLAYLIYKSVSEHELVTSIVKDIATLTSTLIPQGLILAATIFFAYGAIKMFREKVLLQEINSIETLGRIKQLCLDKTGTLTENTPVLEKVEIFPGFQQGLIDQLTLGYFQTNQDNSQTSQAIQIKLKATFTGKSLFGLPFSSERKYGIANLENSAEKIGVVMGAPDILEKYLKNEEQKGHLLDLIKEHASAAKRLLLIAKNIKLEEKLSEDSELEPVALYILQNPLRPGTMEIIKFFQDRQIRVRVISGDNLLTVQAVASQAGIHGSDMAISGPEMEKWDETDYEERVPAYHIFARIRPEQKEKIITILKTHGFTAMVGDGANDALAIKKADLGIAMFEGSAATRQIAQIILMNNSFSALPKGIQLAETVITNIELIASIFFNEVAIGLFLFLFLVPFGFEYPFSPRNITLINYFTIGFPLLFWTILPAHKIRRNMEGPFLRYILPFSLIQGIITAAACTLGFLIDPREMASKEPNVVSVLVLIGLGFWFFYLIHDAYAILKTNLQYWVMMILAGLVSVFLGIVFYYPDLASFFNLEWPGIVPIFLAFCLIIFFGWLEFLITERWVKKMETEVL